MVDMQIDDVPEDVLRELTERAARAGQSLSEYAREQLTLAVGGREQRAGPTSGSRPLDRVGAAEIVRAMRGPI